LVEPHDLDVAHTDVSSEEAAHTMRAFPAGTNFLGGERLSRSIDPYENRVLRVRVGMST